MFNFEVCAYLVKIKERDPAVAGLSLTPRLAKRGRFAKVSCSEGKFTSLCPISQGRPQGLYKVYKEAEKSVTFSIQVDRVHLIYLIPKHISMTLLGRIVNSTPASKSIVSSTFEYSFVETTTIYLSAPCTILLSRFIANQST